MGGGVGRGLQQLKKKIRFRTSSLLSPIQFMPKFRFNFKIYSDTKSNLTSTPFLSVFFLSVFLPYDAVQTINSFPFSCRVLVAQKFSDKEKKTTKKSYSKKNFQNILFLGFCYLGCTFGWMSGFPIPAPTLQLGLLQTTEAKIFQKSFGLILFAVFFKVKLCSWFLYAPLKMSDQGYLDPKFLLWGR